MTYRPIIERAGEVINIRTAHERRAYPQDLGGESRTKQSHKAECDINNIMRQFARTGVLNHVRQHGGSYGNFLSASDFQDHSNAIIRAREMFESLPSKIRKRFQNDPAEFLAFVQDEANTDELIKMGLAKAPIAKPKEASPEASPASPSGDAPAPSEKP